MRNIVLIGMPGCGKSTVGVVLAKALGMDFVDSDLVIQSTMHATLAQLIEQHGDDGFRDIENRVNASIDVQIWMPRSFTRLALMTLCPLALSICATE